MHADYNDPGFLLRSCWSIFSQFGGLVKFLSSKWSKPWRTLISEHSTPLEWLSLEKVLVAYAARRHFQLVSPNFRQSKNCKNCQWRNLREEVLPFGFLLFSGVFTCFFPTRLPFCFMVLHAKGILIPKSCEVIICAPRWRPFSSTPASWFQLPIYSHLHLLIGVKEVPMKSLH